MFRQPVYESKGPSFEQVRKDVSYILSDIVIPDIELGEKEKIIEDALIKVIPNSRDDFGSYRGYIIFSIGKQIAKEVIDYIHEESRNLEYFTLQKIVETAPIGFKIQHTIYATIEYLFFDNSEKMTVFFARHYLNFLMSCLMFITFYKILRLRFDKIYSSIGLIMIILSPKIFSHYYYNPNDIWAIFSASLVIYFSLYFLKKNKTKYFYFLSFVFAFSINTRLIFVYFYLIFLFFLFCKTKKLFDIHLSKKIFFQFFLFLLFLFLIIF